ncbi:hypothetical protein IMSAGC014_02054 [Bacteroidaceae bacterium]|nr:hypothetical protein IMSAGC014_02054 [Bacteroidaceae bacterium]
MLPYIIPRNAATLNMGIADSKNICFLSSAFSLLSFGSGIWQTNTTQISKSKEETALCCILIISEPAKNTAAPLPVSMLKKTREIHIFFSHAPR